MQVELGGDAETKERFVRYMASNPAARKGWVNLERPAIEVDEDYLAPFREIAANFGLEVMPPEAIE